MSIDDAIDIQIPAQDSQYRLLHCPKCKSDNVAYVHYDGKGGAAWRVTCFGCGYTVDKGNRVRHDAQLNWNKDVRTNE